MNAISDHSQSLCDYVGTDHWKICSIKLVYIFEASKEDITYDIPIFKNPQSATTRRR